MANIVVNAIVQANTTPEYATKLVNEIRDTKNFTIDQIAKKTGLHRRTIHRSMELGITKFPVQFILECLAGRR